MDRSRIALIGLFRPRVSLQAELLPCLPQIKSEHIGNAVHPGSGGTTRDRNRSPAIAKINRHKSSIGNQHRAILSQLPA